MAPGIILVHGYTGSNQDLDPLARQLAARFGADSVQSLALPGHGLGEIPAFDEERFIGAIHQATDHYQIENRLLIIIGHSTGGNLALAALQRFSIIPALLILISVPPQIDAGYFVRWESHREGREPVPLVDVALMIKLINAVGSKRFAAEFPVLIIHGEADRLVLSPESRAWETGHFAGPIRAVTIPEADHDLFKSSNGHLAVDLIQRAIADVTAGAGRDPKVLQRLIEVEPGFQAFWKAAPFSECHSALSPGAQRVIGKKPVLGPAAINDPVLANIEITTYCNLHCKFCARARLNKPNRHMPLERFRNLLAVLPHCYKIVLVGLGEPLMHPQIADFVQYAKSMKRKVGLVTNAMLLTTAISHRLLEAGLDSIAFSLDGFDGDLSSVVRLGTDFDKVILNIREFVAIANASARQISKAVFSAVSIDTVFHLNDLIDCISELGVDVLMLSDLNFRENLGHTLWRNIDAAIEARVKNAVRHAFSKNLPVLSVRGLEEFGLEKRYHDALLIPPDQLYRRSTRHTWCLSPWQTVPVDVDGNVTLCDCQPGLVLGNLFRDSFSGIWNGETLQKYRAKMAGPEPPEACQICPRF